MAIFRIFSLCSVQTPFHLITQKTMDLKNTGQVSLAEFKYCSQQTGLQTYKFEGPLKPWATLALSVHLVKYTIVQSVFQVTIHNYARHARSSSFRLI